MLHIAIPALSPLFPPLKFSNSTSYSSASYIEFPIPPHFRRLLLRFEPRRLDPIRCSVSLLQSHGAVDYEKKPALKWNTLFRRISTMENPDLGAGVVLEQCEVEEEEKLSKWLLCRVAKELRRFRRFKLALEVYEWMTARADQFPFTSGDMAIHLDLISKVHGIPRAEHYFSTLSNELKDKRTYGSLLNAYAKAKLKQKAESLLKTMKDNKYVTDALPFNVIMTLHMNLEEHDKVAATINEMKENSVAFDVYTYNIWITNSAAMDDLDGMERVVEEMISDTRISPNWTTYSTLATMYIKAVNLEKAEACLKEIELRRDGDRKPFNYLIGYYCSLGKREEVYRIWSLYKSSFPTVLNLGYQAMLAALVRLGDIDGAEAVYDEWLATALNYDPRICNIVMGWYARQGLVYKAEALLDRLVEKGGKPKPVTWEILAEGYIKEREVSKAVSCMKNAASYEGANRWRPKPVNVANIMALCREVGKAEDVESLVDVLRSRGCLDHVEYKALIKVEEFDHAS